MKTNTVIIGSGIAGMTAAIYLKRADIDFVVIESSAPGGQILRTSTIENYPGFKEIDGPEFAMNVYKQLNNLDVKYIYDEVIEIVDNDLDKFVKTTNQVITCKNIIIATGRTPKRLGIENEEKFTGKGISYCALCDGNLYKNKDVAIVGAGNSAFEESLYLSKICNNVTIIARHDVFKADDILVEKVKNTKNIEIFTHKEVKEIIGNEKVEQIILNDGTKLDVAGLFIYIGQQTNIKPYEKLNITNKYNYINVNCKMETSIPSIYACGDCINKDLYQIITAASEGAIAANQIIKKEG